MGSKAHHDPVKSLVRGGPEDTEITFPALALNIVWGSDPRYWRLPENSADSKSDQPVELIQVCWLEVTGVAKVKKDKRYKVSFDLALKSDAFGWNGCQVYIMAKVGKKGKYKWRKITLNHEPNKNVSTYPPGDDMIVEVAKDEDDPNLYFGLYEVWSGKWKGGLQIHKATLTRLD